MTTRGSLGGWFLLGIVLQGCGLAGLVPSPSDGCTLEVVADSNGSRKTLKAPYSFAMTTAGIHGQGAVSFQGTGWKLADIVAIRPDGSTSDTYRGQGDMINMGFVAFPVDAPGTWRSKVVDGEAHCSRDFTVDGVTSANLTLGVSRSQGGSSALPHPHTCSPPPTTNAPVRGSPGLARPRFAQSFEPIPPRHLIAEAYRGIRTGPRFSAASPPTSVPSSR